MALRVKRLLAPGPCSAQGLPAQLLDSLLLPTGVRCSKSWLISAARGWASATGAGGDPPAPSSISVEAQDLLHGVAASKVLPEIERLRQEHSCISFHQLTARAAAASGLPPADAEAAVQSLARGGALLLNRRVAYLRPWEVVAALEAVLPSEASREQATARLAEARVRVAALEDAEGRARGRAQTKARLLAWGGLAALLGQWGLLFRLTFWELSWDVMEPISFFAVSGTSTLINYLWWMAMSTDFEYSAVNTAMRSRWEAAGLARAGVNPEALPAARRDAEHWAAVVAAQQEAERRLGGTEHERQEQQEK